MEVAQNEEQGKEMEMGARGRVIATSSGQAQSKHMALFALFML
jgi:hypothetical protein